MKSNFFSRLHPLPTRLENPHVVSWHGFRTLLEAESYADNVILNDGQTLTGGIAQDSVGLLWWVGVEVADLSRWGNSGAINKHAA